jgi:uridine kinase
MMTYDLEEINFKTVADPAGFVAGCEAAFRGLVSQAADRIAENLKKSPIVLLSGPSGSGKTTTAQKIEEELGRRGIRTYTVSMDNYFQTVDPATSPRTPEGGLDFESPNCLESEHLTGISPRTPRGTRLYSEI